MTKLETPRNSIVSSRVKNVMPEVLPHCSPMESITVIASRSQIYSTTSSLLFSLLKIPTTTLPKMKPANHPIVRPIVVNRKGVLKLLNDINPYKATGPDAIPGRLLKSLSDEVADILTMIFQASLDQGKIPQDWKKAFISPIFKKGDRHKPANYRPVSLFPNINMLQDT